VATLALLLALLIGNLALSVLGFWLGMRWVKAPAATFGRAVAIAVLAVVIGLGVSALSLVFRDLPVDKHGVAGLVMLAATVVAIPLLWFLTQKIARTTFWRTGLIWLMQIALSAGVIAAVNFVVKPYIIEAFEVQSNAMAPSIVGWHRPGTCPHCGARSIIPASDPNAPFPFREEGDRPGTCPTCGKFGKSANTEPQLLRPDLIVVNKLLAPGRWDVVEYRFPLDEKAKYVSRIVGLPGETVYLDEGAVWINDVKEPLPEDIGKWAYAAMLEDEPTRHGSRENPWRLQAGECCVLGDFGWNASDSRFWGVLPIANIEGVVALRYWPPARWAILR
jgi:signal peptidase I